MKPQKIAGFVSGLITSINACTIISRRVMTQALDLDPENGDREPPIAHALGAINCAAELCRVLLVTAQDIADGNELSLCGESDGPYDADEEREKAIDGLVKDLMNTVPVDGTN